LKDQLFTQEKWRLHDSSRRIGAGVKPDAREARQTG